MVYPRTNKQNQKKKRKVEPPTPQVGNGFARWLLPGGAGEQEEPLESERASGPSPKLEVEEGVRSGLRWSSAQSASLLPSDDLGLLSEPQAGPTTGTGRPACVVGASLGVSSQEAGAEEQQHSMSLFLAVLLAAGNREHARSGCLPHNIPQGLSSVPLST